MYFSLSYLRKNTLKKFPVRAIVVAYIILMHTVVLVAIAMILYTHSKYYVYNNMYSLA